jgi:DNA-binding response OmpR family regulator
VSNPKVLIVDADPEARLRAVQPLRAAGYLALTADDAVSAQRLALKEQPQVLVVDLKLPGGDGFQVMERLRATPATAGIPVVIISADAGQKERALAAGAVDFLAKPVDARALVSTVHFVLGPLAPAVAAPEPAALHDPSSKTVLVVDDDADVRLALGMLLKSRGYRVIAAEDAISAVKLAVAGSPDLVLLDIGLPGGEGFVVMQRLQALPALATVPVIVITGRDPAETKEKAIGLGAVAFLQKPVDNRTVMAAVRAAFDPASA